MVYAIKGYIRRSIIQDRRCSEKNDKAKTVFFSNISHEFRTPLTLMQSPLESVLGTATYLEKQHRSDLEISLRNTLRLQKLVNTLLDFSRIEAGKMAGKYEWVDIGKLTIDLASSFRSAIEAAGIRYDVLAENIDRKVSVVWRCHSNSRRC